MTKQHKVAVDGEGLRNLAGHCRRAGTQDAWIDVALIWIDAAEPEIARLRAERDALLKVVAAADAMLENMHE